MNKTCIYAIGCWYSRVTVYTRHAVCGWLSTMSALLCLIYIYMCYTKRSGSMKVEGAKSIRMFKLSRHL